MLNSWFAKHDSDKEIDPTRRSTDGPRNTRRSTVTTEPIDVLNREDSPQKGAFTIFTGPHDDVLEAMHGQKSDSPTSLNHDADEPRIAGNESNRPSPTPGAATLTYNANNTSQRVNVTEILHDPFDGTPLGALVPSDANTHTEGPVGMIYGSGKNQELWSHLSKVLELQSHIARMHMDMEGVGSKTGDGKGKGKGATRPTHASRTDWRERKSSLLAGERPRAGSASVGGETEGEHDVDEEGVDVAEDEESEKNRAREEEFAKLADQFDERKDSINGIMSKLDDLSIALTEFHALQAPKIEFPTTSRVNSLATSPESLSATFTRPPLLSAMTLPSTSSPSGAGIIPVSLSRTATPAPKKHPLSSLIVNTEEPGTQTHVFDSPVSTIGSLLPPAE